MPAQMKTYYNNFVNQSLTIFLTFFFFQSCSENKSHDREEESVVVSSKEYDMIISRWYLKQYLAIEEIEKVTGAKANIGSKVTDSPSSLLHKQKIIASQYINENSPSVNLDAWSDLQKTIYEKLVSSVGLKISPNAQILNSPEKGIYYIEKQEKLIDELDKKYLPGSG